MYSPKSIANFFLDLANQSGTSIDPMKLQKLVYYANGWYAGYTGNPLINEPIEAWPYGPVIPSLYQEFKRFGRSTIRTPATDDFGAEPVPVPSDPSVQAFLRNIWNSYSGFSGIKLSDMTHAPGGPWDLTRQRANGARGMDIPNSAIVDHFKGAIANTGKTGAQ